MPSSTVASARTAVGQVVYRRLPIGAEPAGDGRSHLRVWAPRVSRVDVVLESGVSTSLNTEDGGYFSGLVSATIGDRYRFRLDGSERLFPDPASRFQPLGPHGPSEIVDPSAYRWSDETWHGV